MKKMINGKVRSMRSDEIARRQVEIAAADADNLNHLKARAKDGARRRAFQAAINHVMDTVNVASLASRAELQAFESEIDSAADEAAVRAALSKRSMAV